MPRHPSNRLETLGQAASRKSLVTAALHDAPLVGRSYGDASALAGLRHLLHAAATWAGRIDASVPARLMVAGLLLPELLARIADHIAEECHRAAPPKVGSVPSRDYEAWKSQARSEADEADKLIHILTQLGEHVVGSWRAVPTDVGPAGVAEESPYELEYEPPSEAIAEIIVTSKLVDETVLASACAAEEKLNSTKVRLLAASASHELDSRLNSPGATVPMRSVASLLQREHAEVLAVHIAFIGTLEEIRAATRENETRTRSWWREKHAQLIARFAVWSEQVPPLLEMSRQSRQGYKRNLNGWVAYVSQYTMLMSGNAAAYELVKMITHLRKLCARLVVLIDRMSPGPPRIDAVPTDVSALHYKFDRMLVPDSLSRYWHAMLRGDAQRAGKLIALIVGDGGQSAAVTQKQLITVAGDAGILTARTKSSREGELTQLLIRMQNCGLVAKVPVSTFRENDDAQTTRTSSRRHIHVARDWWFNPLGSSLAHDSSHECHGAKD